MDNITSSGNGWVNEVMTELYSFCKAENLAGCRSYLQFIHSSRWLVQNVYTPANSFDIKNSVVANGGVIRNFAEKSIRTDAVCHSLNSLVGWLKNKQLGRVKTGGVVFSGGRRQIFKDTESQDIVSFCSSKA